MTMRSEELVFYRKQLQIGVKTLTGEYRFDIAESIAEELQAIVDEAYEKDDEASL